MTTHNTTHNLGLIIFNYGANQFDTTTIISTPDQSKILPATQEHLSHHVIPNAWLKKTLPIGCHPISNGVWVIYYIDKTTL